MILGMAIIALLLLPGCGLLKGLNASASFNSNRSGSVVRAASGGQAVLIVTACPRTREGGEAMRELFEMLTQNPSAIVTAEDGAQAKLVLNGCPFPITTARASRR